MPTEQQRLRYPRAIICFAIFIAALAYVLLHLENAPNSDSDRVSQMEFSINRLRENNHSANLNIDAIVEHYFHPGDEIGIAEIELKKAGYSVQTMTDGQKESAMAEKKVCRHLASLPGFCDEIRIIITFRSGLISNASGFVFYQSL